MKRNLLCTDDIDYLASLSTPELASLWSILTRGEWPEDIPTRIDNEKRREDRASVDADYAFLFISTIEEQVFLKEYLRAWHKGH